MDLESVRRYIEKGGHEDDKRASKIEEMPLRFFERFVLEGLHIDLIEPGRVVCSMKVPPRLLNGSDCLHAGATAMLVDVVGSAALIAAGVFLSGVSVEINVSYLDAAYADDEIEIEARVLRAGKAVGSASVDFRKKKSGAIIAQGRHTKYFRISSKISFSRTNNASLNNASNTAHSLLWKKYGFRPVSRDRTPKLPSSKHQSQQAFIVGFNLTCLKYLCRVYGAQHLMRNGSLCSNLNVLAAA
ncbi:hypothetical protein NC651_011157 [Populus alba x Populus x berolinensis]|nr:hypothetical protein NC651_011157 [Populus alba x Populus x berolinensis]